MKFWIIMALIGIGVVYVFKHGAGMFGKPWDKEQAKVEERQKLKKEKEESDAKKAKEAKESKEKEVLGVAKPVWRKFENRPVSEEMGRVDKMSNSVLSAEEPPKDSPVASRDYRIVLLSLTKTSEDGLSIDAVVDVLSTKIIVQWGQPTTVGADVQGIQNAITSLGNSIRADVKMSFNAKLLQGQVFKMSRTMSIPIRTSSQTDVSTVENISYQEIGLQIELKAEALGQNCDYIHAKVSDGKEAGQTKDAGVVSLVDSAELTVNVLGDAPIELFRLRRDSAQNGQQRLFGLVPIGITVEKSQAILVMYLQRIVPAAVASIPTAVSVKGPVIQTISH